MHITTLYLGQFTLNASFILYLMVYLPQIIHNRCKIHLASLSGGMHLSLFCGYLLDLFYGYSKCLPWQYKTVSIVGIFLLLIQHLQLINHHKQQKQILKLISHILMLFAAIIITWIFFTSLHQQISVETTNILGYTARFFFLIYLIPQLIKNKRRPASQAISHYMIYLSLILCICDGISAWCLDWGWPNKIAGPFTLIILITLLKQQNTRKLSTIKKLQV